MARESSRLTIRRVLAALATIGGRERKTFRSIASNNFFLITVIFLRQSGIFLYLIGAVVVLFPLSADPLRKIPPERLALWPLTRGERRKLRFLSPWINPLTWILAAFAAWAVKHSESWTAFVAAAVLFGVGFFVPHVSGEPRFLRWIPPIGGQLVRKNLREILLTLDFYLALVLSIAGLTYRLLMPQLPDEAVMVMTLLIVLAMSSYAQCLFGLESVAGLTRYQLLPIPGWRVIAQKDAAFLLVIVVLTTPLSPLTGLAAGLAALTLGHAASVTERREQTRWRFSSGASFGHGFTQVIAMMGAGVTAYRISPLILIPCFAGCAGSAWWLGRKLRAPAEPD